MVEVLVAHLQASSKLVYALQLHRFGAFMRDAANNYDQGREFFEIPFGIL